MPDAWFRSGAFPALESFDMGQDYNEGLISPKGNLSGTLPHFTGGAMLRLRARPCPLGSPVLYE